MKIGELLEERVERFFFWEDERTDVEMGKRREEERRGCSWNGSVSIRFQPPNQREIRDGERKVRRANERSTPKIPELIEPRCGAEVTLEASDTRDVALQNLEDPSKTALVLQLERLQWSLV